MALISEDDLFSVLDLLWDARPKWRCIGLGLKISQADLNVIDKDNQDTDDKFRSMFENWLKKGKYCTWDAVCEVLSARPVGCKTLADEVRRRRKKCADGGEPPLQVQNASNGATTETLQSQAACIEPADRESQPLTGTSDAKTCATLSQEQPSPVKMLGPTIIKPPSNTCMAAVSGPEKSSTPQKELSLELANDMKRLGDPGPQGIDCSPTPTIVLGSDLAQTQLPSQIMVQSETTSFSTKDEPACADVATHMDSNAPKASCQAVFTVPEETQGAAKELSLKENIKLRHYQDELAGPGLQGKNYILVAPTGSGKTLVAGYIIMHHLNKMLKEGKRGKVAFVIPTRQLARQQEEMLKGYVPGLRAMHITGASGKPMQPLARSESIDVIVCTAGKLRGELKTNGVKITDLTLIFADECHHAGRPSNYSDIMEFYIRLKLTEPSRLLPQVVGMTASPGAGKGKSNISTVMEHQLSLCATMDATSGIMAVGKNVAELESVRNTPKSYIEVKEERDSSDPFILHVCSAMETLEQYIALGSSLARGSSRYNSWLQNEKEAAEIREEDERERISVLDRLSVYSQCLMTYSDFRHEDAVSVLEEVEEFRDQTDFEHFLFSVHTDLMEKLSRLPKIPNPLLQHMETILRDQFTRLPQSKGIFFVRAIKHTRYVTNWIKNTPTLSHIIRVAPITGYSRGGMQISEQLQVLEGFRQGKYNLLASTSVLEEGLDVPECNFVIRYQNVSNEIAQVQAKGRARAQDSRMYTVVSTNPNRYYWYLVAEEKQHLVQDSITALQDKQINTLISPKQKSFIEERDRKARLIKSLRSQWPDPENVDVLCKKCKVFACKGSDIFTYALSCADLQYVVPDKSFRSKYDKKEHDKPTVSDDFAKPYRIYCRSQNCRSQWGVIGSWGDTGFTFPVLKCKSFLFKYRQERQQFKQWKDIRFEIQDIKDWADFEDDINENNNEL